MTNVVIQQSVMWYGASGRQYFYDAFELLPNFPSGVDGNYIYSKVEGNLWIPLYIGEGDLGDRVSVSHHGWNDVLSKGATHVHVHANNDYLIRKMEEEDLLANHPNAYHPIGCNVRIGG